MLAPLFEPEDGGAGTEEARIALAVLDESTSDEASERAPRVDEMYGGDVPDSNAVVDPEADGAAMKASLADGFASDMVTNDTDPPVMTYDTSCDVTTVGSAVFASTLIVVYGDGRPRMLTVSSLLQLQSPQQYESPSGQMVVPRPPGEFS